MLNVDSNSKRLTILYLALLLIGILSFVTIASQIRLPF